MEVRVFELNLMKMVEDNEACEIEKETKRVKCKENMSKLEVKNDEIESDSKYKTKEFDICKKEIKTRNKELEEETHEQERKLKKIEKVNEGLAEHVNHKEMKMNEVDRNQRKRD